MEQVASWTKTGTMVAVKEETVEMVVKEETVEMGVKEEGVQMGEVETRLEVGSDASSSAIVVKEEGEIMEGVKEEGEDMETETEEGEEVWLEVGSDITSSAIVISSTDGSEGDPIIKEELGVTLETPP